MRLRGCSLKGRVPMADQMNPVLKDIFQIAYRYRQKYQNPVNTEHFWNHAAEDMQVLAAHCKHHPFAEHMLMACYADIERELKENEPPEQMKLI